MSKFAKQRRQQFLPELYYREMSAFMRERIEHWKTAKVNVDESDDYRRLLGLQRYVQLSCELFLLRFTGGERLELLRDELQAVIAALETKKQFEEGMKGLTYACPLFGEIDDYELVLQLISASILFHREDLLPRLKAMFDPVYKNTDAVYQKLTSFREIEHGTVDQLVFKKPYSTLLESMRADTKERAADKLNAYCKEWYPGLKKAPWYDSHLRIKKDDGDYSGYWAFEAGAVAYLYELDDSKIDHMVYPRDLVAFARNFKG